MEKRFLILIIDDSEQVLTMLSTCLHRMNFEVLPVQSGPEALNFIQVMSPDAVFLDTRMPVVTGEEVLRQIRGQELLPNIPIVLISDHQEDSRLVDRYNCTGFLKKPILLDSFHTLLSELFPFPKGPRQHLRAPMNEKVTLHYDDRYTMCQAVSLSEGGIYLRRVTPLPVGAQVAVSIPEDGIEKLRIRGEVIYTRKISGRRFTIPPGMAIRFTHVSTQEREILHRIVTNLLVGDLLEEQVEQVLSIKRAE
jgi:CheY-like chemotaxis protein